MSAQSGWSGFLGSPLSRPLNMVHHTINTKMPPAARASSKIMPMSRFLFAIAWVSIVIFLASCSTPSLRPSGPSAPVGQVTSAPASSTGVPQMPLSRWRPVPWSELPGWEQDDVSQFWPALRRSCQRKTIQAWDAVCTELEGLSIMGASAQRQWLMQRFQAYRLEDPQGRDQGLLTAYFEPSFAASRVRRPGFEVPIYMPPAELTRPRDASPWYSRREIETLAAPKTALRGREIAFLSDPIDAMVLHIQGSGRLQLQEADGRVQTVRLSFAATNQHPYQSVGRWLLDQRLTPDASWPGIKKWLAANPERRNELLWANPRYVFFKEAPLLDPDSGPRGAQGVTLTAGRSIAVDPQSMPYGTPVWLASEGAYPLRRLVVAQDTGSAIVGAIRADYFVGSGDAAGDMAGRLRQNLRLWVLWPK